jgi:hypothetical protein
MKTLSIVSLAAAGALAACSLFGPRTVPMEADPSIPAAEGSVKFTKSSNDNTGIALTVKHLANPEKLTPPAHAYVVWLRTAKDSAPQNIGSLTVDENLDGTLDTVTAQHAFELFITAEASGQAQKPEGPRLLWTRHSPE